MLTFMTYFRVSEAARLIGVGDDTIRRWVSKGLLEATVDEAGVQVVSGVSIAERVKQLAPESDDETVVRSARNSFTGIVTRVEIEGLVAVVELQSGPNRVVSMMTSEACRELGITVGSRATGVVKATQVIIERERNS